jgi:16S rRNA (cytosine1402-N4)-methyltransferase
MSFHEPVLLNESIDFLVTKINGVYFDGTAGFGGHTGEILNRMGPEGRLIATDKDVTAIDFCKKKFRNDGRFYGFQTAFTNIDTIGKIEFIDGFDGIFADLGVSSFQLDNVDSGFTFREDANLDLRMNKNEGLPASEILNTLSKNEIADILFKFGEEKNARLIADKIVQARSLERITNTSTLKKILEEITPQRFLVKSLSRVFQALRIFVNNELEELKIFIDKSVEFLVPGGRLVIISYHSLEDRIVKEKFKYENLSCICPPGTPICICGKKQRLKIITRKPVVPSEKEIESNRRSRSAKMRVAEKI